MVHTLIISHGELCNGMMDTVKMVAGDDFNAKALPLYPGVTSEEYREQMKKFVEEREDGSGTLIFTDLKGGTPYLSASYLAKNHKICVVTGMNLPLIFGILSEMRETTTLEEISTMVKDPLYQGITSVISGEGGKKREKLSIGKN